MSNIWVVPTMGRHHKQENIMFMSFLGFLLEFAIHYWLGF
jgi:hypothetical protein